MAEITLKGRVHRVGEVYQNATFRKQEIVLDTGEKYDKFYPIEFKQADVDNVPSFNSEVEIDCYVNGSNKAWTDKSGSERFFLSLTCKSINVIGKASETVNDQDNEIPF